MLKWLIIAALVCSAAAAGLLVGAKYLPHYLERRLSAALQQKYAATVQFGSLAVSVYPSLALTGTNLVIRHKGFTGVPPLIRASRFSAEAGLWQLLRPTHHLSRVHVRDLEITIPPHRSERPQATAPRHKSSGGYRVMVDTLVTDNVRLVILPEDPQRPPKVFVIHRLVMHNLGRGRAMPFAANLINPQPRGQIISIGTFGPWNADDPAQTPLAAQYQFLHADLGTIKGIGGTLSSKGRFSGRLNRIEVTGETTTPNFKLSISRSAVPLETHFHAIVDGTNGNTFLDSVRAQVLGSFFTAKGGVFRQEGHPHRTVMLDVRASGDHLQDLLRLAVKARTPPMNGLIDFQAKLEVPPGKGDVLDRMKLSGSFVIRNGFFSKPSVQAKIDELSHRSLGHPNETNRSRAPAEFSGRFALANGIMSFPGVTFSVPGAAIHLSGRSNIRTESLNFAGTVALRAEVSQLTTGWKSVLLRPVDPLFRRGKMGTVVPITVTGTESDPDFGIQIRRALLRR